MRKGRLVKIPPILSSHHGPQSDLLDYSFQISVLVFPDFCTSTNTNQPPHNCKITKICLFQTVNVAKKSWENNSHLPGNLAHTHPHQLPLLVDSDHTGAVLQGLDVYVFQPGGVGQAHAQGP